jgi:DNA-binding PadR family transcriptional regulator
MTYQVSSLGISVLALLRARLMHGYEMFQTLVERHADRIVKVRPGSLYHVVDRLTEEKLIRRADTRGTVSGPSGPSAKSPTPASRRSPTGWDN